MNQTHLIDDLEALLAKEPELSRVVATLRDYQAAGIARDDVSHALEILRERARDEIAEDRILEVMDIVVGFCPRESLVWTE